MKKALITGVTGQDGSYLAEFLLAKGYEVHGIKRRASLFNTGRIDHIYQDPHAPAPNFFLHYGDLSDTSNLTRILQQVRPDEVYNLGAMSHVAVSFESPEYTADVDGIGTLRLLEAIRFLGMEHKTRFYQASTSELYGLVQESPQRESTPFYLRAVNAVLIRDKLASTVPHTFEFNLHAPTAIVAEDSSNVKIAINGRSVCVRSLGAGAWSSWVGAAPKAGTVEDHGAFYQANDGKAPADS